MSSLPSDLQLGTPTAPSADLPDESLRAWLHRILDGDPEAGTTAWAFSLGMVGLVLLNVVAVVLESIDSLEGAYRDLFRAFETVSVLVFTVEYGLRLWTCTLEPDYRHPLRGRLRYAATPLAIVDLVAIVPFYVPVFVWDLRFLRGLRLLRLTRLLKLGRYSQALTTLRNVFRRRREELVVSLVVTLLLMLLGSALLYVVERDAQPDAFSSIPAAFWWATVTLSTVDYGELRPITPIGRLIGVFLALLNLALLAIPTGIIGSGFMEEFELRRSTERCPHCGAGGPESKD